MTTIGESKQNEGQKSVLLNPNLLIIFGVTLMSVIGIAPIAPAFPKIVQELRLPSPRAIGLIITVFTLPSLVLSPILGILIDRVGRKRILVPSLMLFGLAGGACAFVRDFNLLLVLRFIQGLGYPALGYVDETIIGDLFPGRQRAEAMGYNHSVGQLGTVAFPLLGGLLATLGWFYPFLSLTLAIPIGLIVWFGLRNPEPRIDTRLGDYFRTAWRTIKSWQVIVLLLTIFLTFVIFMGTFVTYFPFLMESVFDAPSSTIGLVLSGTSLIAAITASQLGRLTKRISGKSLLLAAVILLALSSVIMPFIPSLWLLWIPSILHGAARGVLFPLVPTLLAGQTGPESRGVTMSLYSTCIRLGQTVGPILMGAVFGLWALGAPFYVGAGLAVVMFVLALFLADR